MSKIDVTSTAIEKGIDAAKGFLDKLVGPTIEETGLLIKDRITFWRFKNQVKMINKAQKFCVENNINPKTIPLKMIHPIMEYSALEESNELQDKWAILLSNMVDSEQNIENHVFPYILSQLSTKEFQIVESLVQQRFKERQQLKLQLSRELELNKKVRNDLEEKIQQVNLKLMDLPKDLPWEERYKIKQPLWSLESELRSLNALPTQLKIKINAQIKIQNSELEEFEFSNLSRLGIIKGISKQVASLESSDLSFDADDGSVTLDDLDIVIEHDYEEYIVTQLGELFIDVCTEKKEKNS